MTPLGLFFLYLAFRLKHFCCDFLLQNGWMAGMKGRPGREGWSALLSHTLTHATGTFLVVMVAAPALWWLAPLDFLIHSTIDRIKGALTWTKGWSHKNTLFWWSFGLDQEAHNLTHLAYIVAIVFHAGGIIA